MSNSTTPEKNITDEIVDGLAKNYTDLEKKFSALEKRQAKTEGLNETVGGLIPKVKTLEIKAASNPKIYVPDYSKYFIHLCFVFEVNPFLLVNDRINFTVTLISVGHYGRLPIDLFFHLLMNVL